jgi:hypothetical protein
MLQGILTDLKAYSDGQVADLAAVLNRRPGDTFTRRGAA